MMPPQVSTLEIGLCLAQYTWEHNPPAVRRIRLGTVNKTPKSGNRRLKDNR